MTMPFKNCLIRRIWQAEPEVQGRITTYYRHWTCDPRWVREPQQAKRLFETEAIHRLDMLAKSKLWVPADGWIERPSPRRLQVMSIANRPVTVYEIIEEREN